MRSELGRGESPQVSTLPVVAIVAGILVLLMLIALGFQPLFRDRIGQTFSVKTSFPAPAVIAGERDQRLALEARQKRELAGAHGRMPIEAAMKAVAGKGGRAFDPIGSAP